MRTTTISRNKVIAALLIVVICFGITCNQAFAASTGSYTDWHGVIGDDYVSCGENMTTKCPICVAEVKACSEKNGDAYGACGGHGISFKDHWHYNDDKTMETKYSVTTGAVIETKAVGTKNNTTTVHSSNDTFVPFDFNDPMCWQMGTPEYMTGLEDCFTTGSRGSAEATGNLGRKDGNDHFVPGYGGVATDSVTFTLKDGVLLIKGNGEVNSHFVYAFANNPHIKTVIVNGDMGGLYIRNLPNLENVIRMTTKTIGYPTDFNSDGSWSNDAHKSGHVVFVGATQNTPKLKNDIGPNAVNTMGADALKALVQSWNLPAWALAELPAEVGGTSGAKVETDATSATVNAMQVSDWARDYFKTAVDAGIIPSNMMDMDFTKAITRAKFCELAVATFEHITGTTLSKDAYEATRSPENDWNGAFNDVDGYFGVQKLYGLNIINGYGNGKFGPEDTLTRAQSATILVRMAEQLDIPTSVTNTAFTDVASNHWASEYIARIGSIGVMNGTSTTTFSPESAYTAEQSVVTMVRLMEAYNK